MTVVVSGKNLAIAGVVSVVGALLSIVGAFLPVESASAAGLSLSTSFFDGGAGKTICVVSLIALVLAGAWLYGRLLQPVQRTNGIIVGCGIVVLLIVGYNWSGLNDDINLANSVIPGAASLGIGYFITAIGGVAMVVGGALGLTKKS